MFVYLYGCVINNITDNHIVATSLDGDVRFTWNWLQFHLFFQFYDNKDTISFVVSSQWVKLFLV